MTVQSPCQRTAPFLHRTWLKGVKALQESSAMGNIISSPMHRGSQIADADGPRPAKRRRLSSPGSFDLNNLVASPSLPDSGPTLRIEVLKLLHKDSKKVKTYQGSPAPPGFVTSKARCRITIHDMSASTPQVLHCQSKICDLITFKNPVGPHRVARVDLPSPFYVPQESLLINRPDDGRFDLSDSYQLTVEFEAADGVLWPPLDSHDFGISAPAPFGPFGPTQRHWVLSSRFDSVFGRLKHPLTLSIRSSAGQIHQQTDYVMDVDLRWSAGFKPVRRLDKDSKSCIRAIDPDVDLYRDAQNDHVQDRDSLSTNGQVNGHQSHEQEDEFLADQTPSRSLRTRGKTKVYNLKVLSDQAQGKERRGRGRCSSTTITEGRVQYVLPADQPICLDLYRCISCGAYHESMLLLQQHLETAHPTYEYLLETTSQGPQFRVTAVCEMSASPMKTNQVGRQVKPFSLHTVNPGDHPWMSSRLGPEHEEPFRLSPPRSLTDRLQSGSPGPKGFKPMAPRRVTKPKASKAVVPDIPQSLFHPISKARLVPGQPVPETPTDDTWLIQKHRECIGDFSDVTAAEKEYIWEWDAYILRKSITSAAYFPREWLGFVKVKAEWLVSEERRILEFGKHCSVLLARDVLDDQILKEAFEFIDDARVRVQSMAKDQADTPSKSEATNVAARLSPRSSQIRKSASGCAVCQLPVLGPQLLICSNVVRLARSMAYPLADSLPSPALAASTTQRASRQSQSYQSLMSSGPVMPVSTMPNQERGFDRGPERGCACDL
ncbi:hypothetical protein HIM_01624 [Hirsutella minnesotensis 3608]|nr:hypothetical protein HIM_01624 [Hirsutella minnesotensis 3608]